MPFGRAQADVAVTYNSRGDILTRSDVGTYAYAGTSSCGAGAFSDGPYAVKAITASVGGTAVSNGKTKRPELAYALMDWVLTPRQVIILDDSVEPIAITHDYSKGMRIDIVDAGIINLVDASASSAICNPQPMWLPTM